MNDIARIHQLEEQVGILTEQLRQVQEVFTDMRNGNGWLEFILRHEFTALEENMLRLLYKQRKDVVTKEALYVNMYISRPNDWPDQRIVDVLICKLRKKLPLNTIKTVWGRGYRVTPEGCTYMETWLERKAAA